jgi:hypothetical protein
MEGAAVTSGVDLAHGTMTFAAISAAVRIRTISNFHGITEVTVWISGNKIKVITHDIYL